METISGGTALAAGLGLTDLDVQTFWGRYFALGGAHSRYQLAQYVSGGCVWAVIEHDIAAYALNEYCTEHGLDHPVMYSDEIS